MFSVYYYLAGDLLLLFKGNYNILTKCALYGEDVDLPRACISGLDSRLRSGFKIIMVIFLGKKCSS